MTSRPFYGIINNMDYKIVEKTIDWAGFFQNERKKTEFIASFQNEVNQLLNNGYVIAGGVSIAETSGPGATIHFAQALIK